MTDGSQFDADYFLHGKATGKSLYTDYRWLPDLTIPMVERIIDHLGIQKGDRVLDFGCARGYTVKAFRLLGHDAFGLDVSEWAISNADEETKRYLGCINNTPLLKPLAYDWVIAKDVLEHIPYVDYHISDLLRVAASGVFVVVPLTAFDSPCNYVIQDYEADVTHVQRRTLMGWLKPFLRLGWSVEVAYRVPGIKDNYYKPGWERGNGFLTARRITE